MRTFWILFAGFVVAVFCLAFGFLLVIPGHGWGIPASFAVYGLVFFPVAFLRVSRTQIAEDWTDRIATAAALIAGALMARFLLTDEYWDRWTEPGGAMSPPMFEVFLILAAGIVIAVGLWAWRAEYRLLWHEIALVTVGVMSDFGLWFEARYESAIWHYRGDSFEHAWIALWCGWQLVAVAALVQRIRFLKGEAAPAAEDGKPN